MREATAKSEYAPPNDEIVESTPPKPRRWFATRGPHHCGCMVHSAGVALVLLSHARQHRGQIPASAVTAGLCPPTSGTDTGWTDPLEVNRRLDCRTHGMSCSVSLPPPLLPNVPIDPESQMSKRRSRPVKTVPLPRRRRAWAWVAIVPITGAVVLALTTMRSRPPAVRRAARSASISSYRRKQESAAWTCARRHGVDSRRGILDGGAGPARHARRRRDAGHD